LTIYTGYFFNVDSLLFSPFSKPAILWSKRTITRVNIVPTLIEAYANDSETQARFSATQQLFSRSPEH